MAALKYILVPIVLIITVLLFTLIRNGANLMQDPGITYRLQTFFTTNVAITADDHPLPELQTPVFTVDQEKMFELVLLAAASSGWEVVDHDKDKQIAHFIVRSPMFLLEDDIYVQVHKIGPKLSSLKIDSRSRTGTGDLAANSGNVQKLVRQLKKIR